MVIPFQEALERDLLVVEATAADLKPYLLSGVLYWSLSKPYPSPYILPKGTLGGLLLRLHRLTALEERLDPEQRQRLGRAARQAQDELDRWVVQAEEKAMREFKARLHAWRVFLEECEDAPNRYAYEYPTQVEGRTILDLLLDFATDAIGPQAVRELRAADHTLREISEPGEFVWDEAALPAFPQERFWWLYVRLKPRPES